MLAFARNVAPIEGTYTALVTPFRDEPGQPIDWAALDALVDAQIAGGVAGIVPCGTTGESPTLSHEEHAQVVERTVKRAAQARPGDRRARGRTRRARPSTSREHAERAGADAVMVVVPYYNKPTQEGLHRHFVEVASRVRVPVVVYNVPGRTGVDLAPETLARICEAAPNVVARQGGDRQRAPRAAARRRRIGDRLAVLCGDDALTLPMIACGARGVISVTSNVLPAEVSRATRLALDGKFDEARRAHLALLPGARGDVPRGEPRARARRALALARRDEGRRAVAARPAAPTPSRAAIAAALETFARGAR